ncbi:MAG: anthranilate phosphoribosyltransferase [Deltaproteobacteria bacterium]|nr:anthranilate phosphoribosyltransferase [Deltaproteobacteria bacterium]MBN2672553.1 anthranilate phosphoribosyltransferase [Deltaproteobacteria bacterium]
MKQYIEPITNRQDLTRAETAEVFKKLVAGEMDPVEIAALLIALRTKGESSVEIAGAAEALRACAAPFERPSYSFVDSCGTGGDGAHTINVSTAAALVTAGMGIPVAKHGNRSISSKCGSADVFEQLGVKIDATAAVSRKCLDEVGICFLFAPLYHSGLRHAGPVRQKLAMRTMMNLLGPLVSPAAPTHQVMGVYDSSLVKTLAEVFQSLGTEGALVVHGSGLDEIAVHGKTTCAMLKNGRVETFDISPEDAGLETYSLEEIRGGTPDENTQIVRNILAGNGHPAHNAAVAINAGALAWVFGKAADLKEGTAMAMEVIRSGACVARAEKFKELSNGA